MLERLKNKLAGKGEAIFRNGDQEVVVLGLSKTTEKLPVTLFRTKSGSKLHRTYHAPEEGNSLYSHCGKFYEDFIVEAYYPDGGGFWDTKAGNGDAWIRSKMPNADLCKGCFYDGF